MPTFTFDGHFYNCPKARSLSARKIGREQASSNTSRLAPAEKAQEHKLPAPSIVERETIFRSETILPLDMETAYHPG